ncbi:MAG: hypothetical protein OET81_12360, partial [Desulfobacteraceae bacterium]|nr:hypothetical protein [Desulfobacteraceae bacterium]
MKNQPKHSVKAKTFKNRNRLFLFAVGLLFLILHLWAFSAPVCAQTISSADNQSFSVGDAATAIETITITDDAVTPTIKRNKDLHIRIP